MFEVRARAEGSCQGIRSPRRVVAGYVSPDLLWPKGAFLDQSVIGYRPSAEPLPLTTVSPRREAAALGAGPLERSSGRSDGHAHPEEASSQYGEGAGR